jgi:energy-coupling factor transporter ATP-binding protein EcfA2
MYERFYELRERPFALSPDPDYLYPSRVHREALDYLRYGLESHAGFIVITGEIGSGKTTLLQTLLRGLDSQTTVGRIVNTILEPRELLETIVIDFGLDPAGRSKPLLLRDLAQYLVDQRLAGRLVLLVIDEAQNLSFAALEELRMLSNLETEKSKLLQIVLVGQPNLREKLVAPELEQLYRTNVERIMSTGIGSFARARPPRSSSRTDSVAERRGSGAGKSFTTPGVCSSRCTSRRSATPFSAFVPGIASTSIESCSTRSGIPLGSRARSCIINPPTNDAIKTRSGWIKTTCATTNDRCIRDRPVVPPSVLSTSATPRLVA